jgi:hypothetical protein
MGDINLVQLLQILKPKVRGHSGSHLPNDPKPRCRDDCGPLPSLFGYHLLALLAWNAHPGTCAAAPKLSRRSSFD